MARKSSTKVRNKRNTRRSGGRGRHRARFFSFLIPGFLRSSHRWAWWLGGVGVVCLYVWVFYYFFVGPTGFRWRALYGDANYPDGFAIHGIDISHYQGNINWDKLSDATIDGFPLKFVIVKSTELRRVSTITSTTTFTKPANTVLFVVLTIFGATSRRQGRKPTSF